MPPNAPTHARITSITRHVATDHAPQKAFLPCQTAVEVPPESILFIRNLRFLDLDLLPDWPIVTTKTFCQSKDAHLQQTGRVHCAEWVLFRLFELWDAKETKARLQPLFPALEPIQSKKLRAALFHMLNNLKNGGYLEKECMLRKSILDECRGEKFENLLFLFSAAVLRKVVMRRTGNGRSSPLALHLATAKTLALADVELVRPLAVAHEVSLRAAVGRRQDHVMTFRGLGRKFAAKQLAMAHRKEKAHISLKEHERSLKTAGINGSLTKRQLRLDCLGDQRWLNVILRGDNAEAADEMFGNSFENVLDHTKTGDDFKHDSKPTTLLADLNKRVTEQQCRLEVWRSFQAGLATRNEELIIQKSPAKSSCKSPQKVQLRSPIKTPRKAVKDFAISPKKLSSEPAVRTAERLGDPVRKAGKIPLSRQLFSRSPSSKGVVERVPESYARGQNPGISTRIANGTVQGSVDAGSVATSTMAQLNLETALQSSATNRPSLSKRPVSTALLYQRSRSDLSMPMIRNQHEPFTSNPPMSSQQDIPAYLASPTLQPAHQPKSTLADRACLSLSLTNSPRLNTNSPMVALKPPADTPTRPLPLIPHSATDTVPSLSERTRKTLFESQDSVDATNKARGQYRKTRSVQIQSSYPGNPYQRTTAAKFLTPQRTTWGRASGLEAKDANLGGRVEAPREELLTGDLDRASVFKTRSRVRVSPPPTGQTARRGAGVDGVDG